MTLDLQPPEEYAQLSPAQQQSRESKWMLFQDSVAGNLRASRLAKQICEWQPLLISQPCRRQAFKEPFSSAEAEAVIGSSTSKWKALSNLGLTAFQAGLTHLRKLFKLGVWGMAPGILSMFSRARSKQ